VSTIRNIKKNEAMGRQIEELVLAEFPEGKQPFPNRGPFDIETPSRIIEVKSCRLKTKNQVYKGKQFFRTGRFQICMSAHERLAEKAASWGKPAFYLFVRYLVSGKSGRIEIVDKRMLAWKVVNAQIEEAAKYTRKRDGLVFVPLVHTLVFSRGSNPFPTRAR